MKVKTYKTRSLHEGIEDIKKELGSDALILSTRSVPVRAPFNLFKKPIWEITAALEEKTAKSPETSSSTAPARKRGLSLLEDSPLGLDEVGLREPFLRKGDASIRDSRTSQRTSTPGAGVAAAAAGFGASPGPAAGAAGA